MARAQMGGVIFTGTYPGKQFLILITTDEKKKVTVTWIKPDPWDGPYFPSNPPPKMTVT
jgi:hypothetical protein